MQTIRNNSTSRIDKKISNFDDIEVLKDSLSEREHKDFTDKFSLNEQSLHRIKLEINNS